MATTQALAELIVNKGAKIEAIGQSFYVVHESFRKGAVKLNLTALGAVKNRVAKLKQQQA